MPSERALLIKQRQQEALQRQKQEIAERDAIRKEKALGITSHSAQHNDNTPQTLHDLFNSRYKPTPNQAPPINNNPENARLRAYEQKRARFLAKKYAEMQQSQPQSTQPPYNFPIQQSQPIPHPTFNTQHEPSYNHNQQIEHTQRNQPTQHSSHNIQQPTYNTAPQAPVTYPPMQQFQNVPQTHNLQNIYENPSPKYISSEKCKSNVNDKYDNEHELRKQKRAEQEQYRQQLIEQMRQNDNKNKHVNKNERNEYFASMSPNEFHENEKELKRAKQEQYRQELLQQMRENENKNKSINKISEPKCNMYDNEYELRKQKKAKQEQYKRELLEQMRQHENKYQSINKTNTEYSEYFGSLSPNELGKNDKEIKRAKQEKYRQELLQQMREQQMKNNKSVNTHRRNNNTSQYKLFNDEKKQMEYIDENKKYNYAKQLEEQVKLKELEKMAEKEKKLLEDRKMLMGGGFLDGFGNNKMKIRETYSPQMHSNIYNSKTPQKYLIESRHDSNLTGLAIGYDNIDKKKEILDKKALYKMELDRQCKELQEKKRRDKLQAEQEAVQLEEKIKKDRQQILKDKYREDLQQQMKDLNERRTKQKVFEDKQDMKLELKIERDRKELRNQLVDNIQNSGIFGKDADIEKLQKAKKQELYQQELKQQAIEAKRKKMEKEREEKEKERQLELKIQKELDELQEKYQREKEMEANMSNLSNIGSVVKIPNVKRSNVNNTFKNMNTSTHMANVSHEIIPKSSNIGVFKNMNMSNASFMNNNIQEQPLSARNPIIEHNSYDKINNKRPSTSKKMYQELLNLKKDLLENQKMIREELQIHKQQIHQQIATVSNQTDNDKLEQTKSKTFKNEMSKISNEIENLKNVLLKQQNKSNPKRKKTPIIKIMENNKKVSEFRIIDDEISLKNIIDKSSKFIPCSVPQTPIRPDTN
eukprot:118721_1